MQMINETQQLALNLIAQYIKERQSNPTANDIAFDHDELPNGRVAYRVLKSLEKLGCVKSHKFHAMTTLSQSWIQWSLVQPVQKTQRITKQSV
jgi:hypothetical protein